MATKPDRLAHGIGTQVVDLGFEPSRELRGTRVGRLVGWKEDAGPTVDYPGNQRGPLVARTAVALDPQSARAAAARGRDVLLTFDSGSSERPIIVALLEPESVQSRLPASPGYEAVVDGRRVVLDAQDEIVLRCGESSITLRRNGRVVISGAYVETCSRGVNRIKGGSVQVN